MCSPQIVEEPLPKVPVEVGLVPHWLAINGVQPRIAEHAPIDKQRIKRRRVEAARPVDTSPGQSTTFCAHCACIGV